MGDTLITVVSILSIAVLMFIFPVMANAERQDDIGQLSVQTTTAEFVDKIATLGYIGQDDYNNYMQKLGATGNTYDVVIEVQILDDNPNKVAMVSGDLIGENVRYSVYTNQILEEINSPEGKYKLKQGDNVIVSATNTNKTIAQVLQDFTYKVVGKDSYKISARASAMVIHGAIDRVPNNETTKPEPEPEPEPAKILVGLNIKQDANITYYNVGDNFNDTGMIVEAIYKYGDKILYEQITNYNITNGTNLAYNQRYVTISYEDVTANHLITVADPSRFEYEETENGIRITKIKQDYKNDSEIIVPQTINGKPVTIIGKAAFNGCDSVRNIVIPYGITTLEGMAITLCRNLPNINIPSSVKIIERQAVAWNDWTNIDFPEGVEFIGDNALECSKNLTTVTIPSTVTQLGQNIFRCCPNLQTINVDEENKNYISENGVIFNKNKTQLVVYPAAIEGEKYVIPEGVNEIQGGAFSYSNLHEIEIPEGITEIPIDTFEGCKNLTEINLPSSVEKIGPYAFYQSGLTNITLPDNLKSIDYCAFEYCRNLTEINLPNSVTDIEYYAFADCDSLTSITFPSSVKNIRWGVIRNCDSLTSVTISNKSTYINREAFQDCNSLQTIRVPEGMSVPEDKWGATNAEIEYYTP